MNPSHAHGLLVLTTLLACGVAAADEPAKPAKPADPADLAFFEKKIRPVLVKHCYECHSQGAKKVKGGLLLDSREGLRTGGESGAALVPGDSKSSLLMEALRYEGFEMPPNGQLPEAVIADFARWVAMGAPDPRSGDSLVRRGPIDFDEARQFWAFQPPQPSEPPAVQDGKWPATDIDRYVLARLEEEGLQPVADADKTTLIRRATFALTGLPPTPAEVQAFVEDDSPEAFARVVDRLLDSPRYGERWGRHWLDVARYAESTGMERNTTYPFAWRYRDYVIDAFNADRPYDEMIVEQLAGDLLETDDAELKRQRQIATGFLAIGPKGLNERNAEKFAMDVVDDQIDATGRAFLGITVSCARCHDHKFDPIPTGDYYAMAGIFRSTETLAGVRGGKRGNNNANLLALASDRGSEVKPAEQPKPEQGAAVKRLQAQLKKAQAEVRRLQKADKQGADAKKDRQQLNQARQQLKRLQKRLAQARRQGGGGPATGDFAMAVRDANNPSDCQICIRGEVTDRGDRVPRGVVTVAHQGTPFEVGAGSGRLELARWIASADNPLTARVMVNRVWHHLFGTGLVATVDNFGKLGERPSHPELLDRLAVEFMQDGWSIKRLIRRLMLSRTWRLSSAFNEAAYEADPEDRLLWRMAPRRLDAEALRDAMLAASGKLDSTRPRGSKVQQIGGGEIGRNLTAASFDTDSNHRSVYLPIVRGAMPESLSLFDVADPNLVVGRRDATTVATQALFLLNSPFVMQQSRALADRILAGDEPDDTARLELAYRLALCRPPTEDEAERAADFLTDYCRTSGADQDEDAARRDAWAVLCQALLASAEFRYVY